MARDEIGIGVLGDRELEKRLHRLERTVQRKIVAAAFRGLAKKVRARVVANLSGDPVEPQTGNLRDAMRSARTRAASRNPRKLIRIGLEMPTREELGIDPDAPHFYPASLEYGHGEVAARPFMRPAIDRYKKLDRARLGRLIKRGIEKAWRRS